jgi:glycosyltransferase involved in cell wall biosynthesis
MESSLGLVLYGSSTVNEEHMGSASNKLFEYAARGIPVVVPDRRSFREFLVGESWVAYADPRNRESMANAIRGIFADQYRYTAMCYAARRAFEQKYNYEHVFAPVIQRLLQLTAGK